MKNKTSIKKTVLRILIVVAILIITASVSAFAINWYVKHTAGKLIVPPEDIPEKGEYDCILVLGCGVYDDGTPSPMLADRLTRAIELYSKGAAPKIIVSGDHGKTNYDEVNVMRQYALDRGIPDEDIFMDHAGFSTYESMYRAKEIFCAEKILIVTQEYHLYRAVYIAKKLGLSPTGVNSDYRMYYGQQYRDIREVAARCKDFFSCIFKPEPTFLGETIPVSGDGTVTQDKKIKSDSK